MTQPGASRALARLREAFHDALFVPADGRLLLTPYAEKIADSITGALTLLATGITRSDFDPKHSERRFTISMSTYGEALLLPPLCRSLERQAPGIRLVLNGPSPVAQGAIADDSVDLSIAVCTPQVPRMHVRKLLHDNFVAAARRDHPAFSLQPVPCAGGGKLGNNIVVADILQSHPNSQAMDWLTTNGVPRIQTRNILASALLVAQSDWIFLLPRLLALSLGPYEMLRILPVAVDQGGFHLCMYWHERFQADAGHRWLRRLIHTMASKLETEDPSAR